jgi:hypothetical protein
MQTLIVLCISLVSGLIGSLLTSHIYWRYERKRLKIDVLRRVVGNRYLLTPQYLNNDSDTNDFCAAINEVCVIYIRHKNVIDALKAYQKDGGTADGLTTLIKEMCSSVNLDYKGLNDLILEKPFAPKRNSL